MRTTICLIICLISAAFTEVKQIYADPTNPACSDNNPGTADKPVCTREKAEELLTGPGQIFLPTGTFTYTSAKRFKLPSKQ